jgi:hypothetical protein
MRRFDTVIDALGVIIAFWDIDFVEPDVISGEFELLM